MGGRGRGRLSKAVNGKKVRVDDVGKTACRLAFSRLILTMLYDTHNAMLSRARSNYLLDVAGGIIYMPNARALRFWMIVASTSKVMCM